MKNSNLIQSTDTPKTLIKAQDCLVDASTIMRQIRLCRSTLGAILDELECGDVGADAVERIVECTIGVTADVESLWEAIGKSK